MLPLLALIAIAPPDTPPALSTRTPQNGNMDAQRAIALQPILLPEAALQPQFSRPQLAQAITPNADGTGTVVTPDGNQIDITGGELSGDGANLFHSFQEFGLTAEQVANFIASPDIQNILSNVNGGNASIINGLLQVSGSNANLYVINPAGIIFGPEGGIDLTGSFTATTANQVGFGDSWLDVLSPAEYEALTGTPDGFAFAGDAGTVLNLGDLRVDPGQSVTLLGGEVINLGTIEAPTGTITLAAIPSENLVRISQENQLLSLEIAPQLTTTGQLALNPLALPELLTGSSLANNDLTIVQNADGTVRLESPTAGATLELGSVIASGELVTEGEQGGQIYLLGQQVSLLNADVNASGLLGGGDIRIGGDFQGQGALPNAQFTLVDGGSTLQADGLTAGDGGSIVVWADDTTRFGGSASVRGTGAGGDGGWAEVSGLNMLEFTGLVDASSAAGTIGTLLLDPTNIEVVADGEADTSNLNDVDDPADPDLGIDNTTRINVSAINNATANVILQATVDITFSADVTVENPDVGLSAIAGDDIFLDSDFITAADILLQANDDIVGDITLRATNDITISTNDNVRPTPDLTAIAGNNITLNSNLVSEGGNSILFQADNDIRLNGNIVIEGDVTLTADADGNAIGGVLAAEGTGIATDGGAVDILGAGLQLGIIDTVDDLPGSVNLESSENITFEAIDTSASGFDSGADVSILANGTVQGLAAGTTINTQGGSVSPSGSVTIQHDGGPTNAPFAIGDASVNGIAGAIAADSFLDSSTDNNPFPVQPNGGTDTPSPNVTITSINAPPTLAAAQQLATEIDQPVDFTVADLNPTLVDANSDITTLAVVSVPAGTLLQNGAPVQPGDVIAPTDALQYIPPDDTTGTLTAFTLQASDGVSTSDLVDVTVDIAEPIPTNLDTLDPTLGIEPPPFPDLPPTEQTLLVGMPLASSPQLEDLSVMGMVLPESGFLIVDAIAVSAAVNSALSPATDLAGPTNTQEAPAPEGTPEPGETVEPDPEPLPPELPPELPPQQEPVSEGGTSDPGPTADPPTDSATPSESPTESAGTPSDSSEAAGAVALQPGDQAETATSPTTPMAQGLKNCQAEAQGIEATAASDRTQSLYASLIDCYESNLATATEQGDSRWVGYSLNNLAISHFVIGDYLTALELHEQQLEQARRLNDRTQEGIALGGIGANYAALGDYATAIDFYEQSLRIMPVETAPQWKALTYRNLGNAYFAEQDYENAAYQQLTSLDISRGAGDTYGEMQAYGNLGSTRAIQGQFTEAIALYEQGLALAAALENDLEAAQLLLGVSTTYAYQQDYEQAYRYSQEALAITRQLGASLGEGIALTNVGNALLYLERLTAAEQALFEAVGVWEDVRAGLGTSDGFKVSIFETQLTAYRNLQQVLVAQNKTDAALTISERSRARAFVELLARGEAYATAAGIPPAPDLAQMQQIAAAQNATLVEYSIIRDQFADPPHAASAQNPVEPQDARLYIWVVAPDGRVEFREVNLQDLPATAIADLVTETRIALTGRDDSLIASERGGLGVIPASDSPLRPGDFVRREGDLPDIAPYQVISVLPDGQTVTVSHPDFVLPDPNLPASELYRVEVEGAIAQPPLQQLHDILIAPIADLLPNNPDDLVIFVPQEQLFLVPFAALQNDQGTYVIEQHTIAVTPSIQVLELTGTRSPVTATEALVVGNPSPMPGAFGPLPSAETEAAVVAESLAATPLLRGAATEAEVKAALPGADIIHLATHGQFNSVNPLQGALALAPDAQNDGFLTAAEILEQPLQASLAILSACDTGRGRITGDGVVGLSRSFMAAGVPQVIVSLWQVPDDQTAELMIAFHEARLQGDRSPHALRKAMLASLESYSDPAVWSAFTQVGNLE